jgi:metal-sulfur cluster biosynthetic enzyme
MTLTAPGCGVADFLRVDIERKLAKLPQDKEVFVEVVFDPPWQPSRMSEAARLQLGLDLDTDVSGKDRGISLITPPERRLLCSHVPLHLP